jgi:PAS domain S-box-containing protein
VSRTIPSLNRRIAVFSIILLIGFVGLTNYLIEYYSDQFREDISRRNLNLARVLGDNVQVFLDHHIFELGESRDHVQSEFHDAEGVRNELDSLRSYYPLFEVVQVLDEKGVVRHISPFDPEQVGMDLSGMSFFRQFDSSSDGVILWSDSFLSPLTNDPAVTVTLPMDDSAMVAQINLKRLSGFIQKSFPFSGGFISIVDRKGVAIAHSDQEIVKQALNLRNLSSVQLGLTGEMGSYNDVYDGARGLTSVSRIDPSGWLVVVFQTDEESLGIVDGIKRYMRFVLLLALLLSFLTISVVHRRGLRTLKNLEEQARKISKGNYDETVEPGYVEYAELASRFNDMAKSIKTREEALQESESNYRELVQSANSIVLRWDLDGRVTFINKFGEEFFGYPQEEILGRTVLETIVPEAESTGRDLYLMIEGIVKDPDKYASNENENVKKNGERVWVNWSNRAIFNKEEQASEILSIGMDVTSRKTAELELENYRSNLEHLVEERTAELKATQAELLIAERLATLGQLTATVSHEIRNPLGTVKNSIFSIGEAIEQNDMSRLGKALRLAERNIRRVDTIISELLDYTRQRELVMVSTLMDSWLGEILDEIDIVPEETTITRELSTEITLKIDQEYLRQAMINILNNAVQAIEENGEEKGNIEVQTAVSGSHFQIRISDNGAGIPKATMKRVLEPLFSTKSFGIGLGIPIVMRIMEQHEGGMEISSEPGKGTVVTLWLPIQDPVQL